MIRSSFALDRLIRHVRTPLFLNAYSLVVSEGASAALGMLYWVLAARLYPTESVGLNALAISTMTLLANVSQLNLRSAMLRFLPNAGNASSRLVGAAYSITLAVALSAGVIFVAGQRIWMPDQNDQNFLALDRWMAPVFVGTVMLWAIFALQDGVLTGLRQAIWVPIENTLFNLAKMAMMVALATLTPGFGIFASWLIPCLATTLVVNAFIFKRLIPAHARAHERATASRATPIVPRHIVSYTAADYLGFLFGQASAVFPFIVLNHAGASATAYFSLAWMMAYMLYVTNQYMTSSFTVEAVANQARLSIYRRHMFAQMVRLMAPVVIGVIVFAPLLLSLFGPAYAEASTTLLRLLALAAIPNIVNTLYLASARVQRKMSRVVAVQFAANALGLGLSLVFVPNLGIAGIGAAWFIGQTIVASAIVLVSVPHFLKLPVITETAKHALAYRKLRRARALAAKILPTISWQESEWAVHREQLTDNDVAVLSVGPKAGAPQAMLKLPMSAYGVAALRSQRRALASLHADARLGEWRTLVPQVLAEGELNGQTFALEQIMPGINALTLLADPAMRPGMLKAAVAAITQLHERTARPARVDAALFEGWVDQPMAVLRRAIAQRPQANAYSSKLDSIAAQLRSALTGRCVSLSRIHGDYWPGNILMSQGGHAVTGIVDWDEARLEDLPLFDQVNLLLSARMLAKRCELGPIVLSFLQGETWSSEERELLDRAAKSTLDEPLDARSMVALFWLRHASWHLGEGGRYRHHWLWITRNVEGVLRGMRGYT
jgi:O-antigen/teichoic acid export membrane protein/aminoglycoside phosphotransferase (APT) family kinase protein